MDRLQILALEPYYGGSHQAFLDGWISHSDHEFTVLGLPAYKWKWRMRHAAVTFAQQLRESPHCDTVFDAVWCSDMLNLAEFIGLAPSAIQSLPRIAYFHENQFTYPVQGEKKQRDWHFGYTNFTTCLAADRLWFNSEYHRQDFLKALRTYLARMPDYSSVEQVNSIEKKSSVQYPGVKPFPSVPTRDAGPMRVCWNARWEHDKNPEDFFAALRKLKQQQIAFQLIVLGESFRNSPEVFATAEKEFHDETLHWGFAESKAEYRRLLAMADVVVSTANHEFFGIAMVEGMAAGVTPVAPDRLAYPEVIASISNQIALPAEFSSLLYGQTVDDLIEQLKLASTVLDEIRPLASSLQDAAKLFHWPSRAESMDAGIRSLTG